MKTSNHKVALLDVNVLIALLDPQHEMHNAAHTWFEEHQRYGWATCPLTENGCLRILAKLYSTMQLTMPEIAENLQHLRSLKGHQFWPEANSILEPGRFQLSGIKPRTITDVYLLDLALFKPGPSCYVRPQHSMAKRNWCKARRPVDPLRLNEYIGIQMRTDHLRQQSL